MSPGAFDPLVYGLGIAVPVAAVATPAFWRASHGLPAMPRTALVTLACLGLSGIASLPVALSADRLDVTSLTALVLSAVLQGLALPILLLLARKP
ncbi:hypothetical protein [Muricoccus radiodurans]|uniref:hypothetical protein n=1 Tax=Muricoccus radiodurans TaxID=2231721 RepID=UPI003CF05018